MSNTIFNFFGLSENPFKISPDPRFLFVTDQSRATSDALAYAIRTRKGLILLTGEVGTGKTMLLRRLLDWLSEQNMPTALIFNSHIKPDHLLDFILNDFGVPCTSTLKSEKLMALNRWLLEQYRAGQTPVLIVDEAQGLEPAALEEVRLLLNFETPREKLLQIVLAGQPELETKLKRHELRQLRQRITIRCRTSPLTLEQTCGYIQQRLRVAGADATSIFEPDAIGSVHAHSLGIPRVINVLCEHSLVNACADGATTVSSAAVERAAGDCQLDRANSIARILNSGSYATTSLSDISSLLAAVSAASESPAQVPGKPQSSEPFPPAPQDSPQHVHPSPAAARANTTEQYAAPTELPLAPPAASSTYAQVPPLQPLGVHGGTIFAQTPLSPTQVPQSRPARPNFLRVWGRSFIRDVRATSRQVRRATHSFEIHRWKPLVRHLRHELRQVRSHASHFWSDPRWQQLQMRTATKSQATWRRLKSAMPRSLTQYLRTFQQKNREGTTSHARRTSLRRWLHGPLISQRKRTQGNQHRSVS
jgi:general secretion pathway protein A